MALVFGEIFVWIEIETARWVGGLSVETSGLDGGVVSGAGGESAIALFMSS